MKEKSGEEVAKSRGAVFSKTDQRYWRDRVMKNKYKVDGDCREAGEYSVRISFRRRREYFSLGTSNKANAANKARDIYISLAGVGWDETIERFKPQPSGPDKVATVGEFLALAENVCDADRLTFKNYCRTLRAVAADICGLSRSDSRFDYKRGGREKWLKRTGRLPLSCLTPAAMQRWKKNYIKRAGDSPKQISSAKTTANSMIRCGKALFSERKILRYLEGQVELPDPVPFRGVDGFPIQNSLYQSKVNVAEVVKMAERELGAPRARYESEKDASDRHQQYKIFLLAIFAGMRRGEIDGLLWRQCALTVERPEIHIEETHDMRLKQGSAAGVVAIDVELAEVLLRFKSHSAGAFVIESELRPSPQSKHRHYRASRHYKKLLSWLRANGVEDGRPIHVLRKEAGSLVNQRKGLIAAQRFLRHTDPRTTACHYVDVKERVTVGLGGLLGDHVSAHDFAERKVG